MTGVSHHSPSSNGSQESKPLEEVGTSQESEAQTSGSLERLMLRGIRFYQEQISPHTPPSCRFQPTCSEYARRAILRYGWHKGMWLTCCRLGRCHPLHPGGVDPVP